MKICECGARLSDDVERCLHCGHRFTGVSFTNVVSIMIFVAGIIVFYTWLVSSL